MAPIADSHRLWGTSRRNARTYVPERHSPTCQTADAATRMRWRCMPAHGAAAHRPRTVGHAAAERLHVHAMCDLRLPATRRSSTAQNTCSPVRPSRRALQRDRSGSRGTSHLPRGAKREAVRRCGSGRRARSIALDAAPLTSVAARIRLPRVSAGLRLGVVITGRRRHDHWQVVDAVRSCSSF